MHTSQDDLLLALFRAADATRARIAAVVEPSGITFQQYMVLGILGDGPEEGVATLDIAARMVERAPGITGLIDRLERRGLVRRERSSADRREIRCLLTAEGRALLDRLESGAERARAQTIAMLTGHEVGVLRHLLLRIGK